MKQETLGRIAIGLSAACVCLVGATIIVLVTPSIRATLGLTPSIQPGYVQGDRIDVPARVYESSPYTVIVFARSNCPVCQRVKPWLAQMTASVQRQTAARVVMVATNAGLDEEVAFGREIGLGQEQVVLLPSQALRVKLVPTVVLVDRRGEVLYSVEGAPESPANLIPRIVNLAQSR
jgi:hypothetical protein